MATLTSTLASCAASLVLETRAVSHEDLNPSHSSRLVSRTGRFEVSMAASGSRAQVWEEITKGGP